MTVVSASGQTVPPTTELLIAAVCCAVPCCALPCLALGDYGKLFVPVTLAGLDEGSTR